VEHADHAAVERRHHRLGAAFDGAFHHGEGPEGAPLQQAGGGHESAGAGEGWRPDRHHLDGGAPDFGPLISERHLRKVENCNKFTKSVGLEVLLEGKRLDRKGYYLTPHVYKANWDSEDNIKTVLAEEVFGPRMSWR
jgi:hypothetical protein